MDNYYPKLDMDNILPVDTDKVVNEPGEEMTNDSTMKAAYAFASESPPVPLPGAYRVAPSPTASAAPQGRVSAFNRSLISIITEDHHDDDATIMVVVPTASVVQENELYAGHIVEAAPWEDPIRPAEVTESLGNLPKDAVWIGKKRVRIFLFIVFVVIAAIVTGLTTALIQSERDQEEAALASLSSLNDSSTRSPSPSPSSNGEKEDKDKKDDGSHNGGTGSGGGGSGGRGNRA
jgi:uncharacterized membrane protein YgcG